MLLSVIASVKGGHSNMYNIIPVPPIYSYPHCWKPRSPSETKEKGINILRSYLRDMRKLFEDKRNPVSNRNDSTCSTLSGANLGTESSPCSSIGLFSDTSSSLGYSSSNDSESSRDLPNSLLSGWSLKKIVEYFGPPKVSSYTNNYI